MNCVITILKFSQSVVVILGAVFVCWQIYLQRKQVELQSIQLTTSNYLAVMEARNRITEREITDPVLMEVYASDEFPVLATLADWQKLKLSQKRLYMHLGTIASAAERAYTFAQSKALLEKDLEAEISTIKELFCLPIFRNSWPYLKTFYRDEFANKVDQMMRGAGER
jgi:hypothetical protein